MALAIEDVLAERISKGIITVKYGHLEKLHKTIFAKYSIEEEIPASVLQHIALGLAGKVPKRRKQGSHLRYNPECYCWR